MTLSTLVPWLFAIVGPYVLNEVLGGGGVEPPENPNFPVDEFYDQGWVVWYEEWSHQPGSACTWPPKK
jgi:hypothetical protein